MIGQLVRFGIVGCCAAAVNMLMVILLVETVTIQPLIANIFAFLIAFNVSYFGHRHWSFNATDSAYTTTIIKFLIVAIASFALNEGIFFILLKVFHLYYIIALFIVLATVPIFTFISSKSWAFR